MRWIPRDYDTWQIAIDSGYTLERFVVAENGIALDITGIDSSYVLLESNIVPLSEVEWDSNYSNNNFAQVAKGTLYEQDSTYQVENVPLDQIQLVDVVNYNLSTEMRHLFALFAAEQDFQVAKDMAMGYMDMTAEVGKTYMYSLRINSATAPLVKTVRVNLADIANLPSPTELKAQGDDLGAMIQWSTSEIDQHYSSYDIERSSDDVSFTKVNDLPFLFSADGIESLDVSIYVDSLPNNVDSFYYRVVGRTAFGLTGPPSVSIAVKGVQPALPMSPYLGEAIVTDSTVLVQWDSFDLGFENEIEGFYIYRSISSTEGFVPLNTTILPQADRNYLDDTPLMNAYYKLEAIDVNGHHYQSSAALVQLPDSIPPLVPVGLVGEFITRKTVQLTWDANTEEDLKGYKVYMANGANGNYAELSSRTLANNQFIYDVETNFDVDSIYFSVLANDQRENYSERCVPIGLARPDVIPPAQPNLFKLSPTPEGISIGFTFSGSDDVQFHRLERKASNGPDWEEVLNIPVADQAQYETDLTPNELSTTCYIDSSGLVLQDYDYRLLAYDYSGNGSSSKVISVRPLAATNRGDIASFLAGVECEALTLLPNQVVYDFVDSILVEYTIGGVIHATDLQQMVVLNFITQTEYDTYNTLPALEIYLFLTERKLTTWASDLTAVVELNWTYAASAIQDFQIFRSAEASGMMLYETIPIEELSEFSFQDLDVKPGYRYFYQIMARHVDGGFSSRSETLMVKVPTEL